MTLEIGYINGQQIVYDTEDPLSSRGVTPKSQVDTQTQQIATAIATSSEGQQKSAEAGLSPEAYGQRVATSQQVQEQLQGGSMNVTLPTLIPTAPSPYISTELGTVSFTQTSSTGSVLPQGYMQTSTGEIVPSPVIFTTSTGGTFIATPTGSYSKGGYVWQTPYGEIYATPDQLQKEILRQMDVQRIGNQILGEQQREEDLSKYSPALSEFGKYHPELSEPELINLYQETKDVGFQTAFWGSKVPTGQAFGQLVGDVGSSLLTGSDLMKNLKGSS